MFRKPWFWAAFTAITIVCTLFGFKYFPHAFPMLEVELTMNREAALDAAKEAAERLDLGPDDYFQAANFVVDGRTRTFVELEGGGTEVFRKMLTDTLYTPYRWQVKHLKEGDANYVTLRFSPTGEFIEFWEYLPEDEPGAALEADSARGIAETFATDWGIFLNQYELVEESQHEVPSGRINHWFVYERPDIQIGEGRYRLRLQVSGDRVTELDHSVKVPEAFNRRYKEMRSANNTIAFSGTVAMFLLYGLGGIGLGLFILMRQGWVLWRKPLFWGFFVSFMASLGQVSYFPLYWSHYDTALSANGFILENILQIVLQFVLMGVALTLTFIAAESMTRKAFPNQLQLWKIWSKDVAASPTTLGFTVAGYWFVGIFFAFDIALYLFANNVLGWWSPAGSMVDPDIVATWFPWLFAVGASLQAGFWEECLFRAIPIAGAALIGARYGGRRYWIIGAFILQALIFGAGHASYPVQPAYARVVELIIPSIGFGLVYLYFGLLPGIITHFAFDVVWFSLPIFIDSSPGAWIDKTLVILTTLIPLFVIFWARLSAGSWTKLLPTHFNSAFVPTVQVETAPPKPVLEPTIGFTSKAKRITLIGGVIGLIIALASAQWVNLAPDLTLNKSEAIAMAEQELASRDIILDDSWKRVANAQGDYGKKADYRFVWGEKDGAYFSPLVGSYLWAPNWHVRFVRFDDSIAVDERAEEYIVLVNQNGLIKYLHLLPEARAGAELTEDEARASVYAGLMDRYQIDATKLKEITAFESQKPNRKGWRFTFSDTANYPLESGEARTVYNIEGDEHCYFSNYLHTPEEWRRDDRKRQNVYRILGMSSKFPFILTLLGAVILAVVAWSRKKFSVSLFRRLFAITLVIGLIKMLNGFQAAMINFSTSEPFTNQLAIQIGGNLMGAIVMGLFVGLMAGLVGGWLREGKAGSQAVANDNRFAITALSAGAIIAGVTALIMKASPRLLPPWNDFGVEFIGGSIPILGVAFDVCDGFLMSATIALILIAALNWFTGGWRYRKSLFGALFVILGIANADISSIMHVGFWIAQGMVGGLILLALYTKVFRFNMAMIPLALFVPVALKAINAGLTAVHPTALPGAILGILLAGALAWYWSLWMGKE